MSQAKETILMEGIFQLAASGISSKEIIEKGAEMIRNAFNEPKPDEKMTEGEMMVRNKIMQCDNLIQTKQIEIAELKAEKKAYEFVKDRLKKFQL